MLSLLFVRSYPMLIIPGILYGISHGISFPVLTAALIDPAPKGFRGRMVVIAQLMFTLGIFLSSHIGGFIAEAVSIDAVVFFTSAFSGTAAVLFIYLTIKGRPCCD
jgi:MFS family permease